jgi:hypothetical protein
MVDDQSVLAKVMDVVRFTIDIIRNN